MSMKGPGLTALNGGLRQAVDCASQNDCKLLSEIETAALDEIIAALRAAAPARQREGLERETRLELATPTLARSCSTN